MAKELLPIKVVLARKDTDYRKDPSAGGGRTIFEPVTAKLRDSFVEQVASIQTAFSESFKRQPTLPAVAKVELKSEAASKSHRPKKLFNERTCPIIGVEGPGELLVRVSPSGLNALQNELTGGHTKDHEANISALSRLSPFGSSDALGGQSSALLALDSLRTRQPIRVRMFRHGLKEIDDAIDAKLKDIANAEKITSIENIDYGEGVRVYAINGATPKAIDSIARFVGTQSVGLFPAFRVVRKAAHVVGPIDERRFPPPTPGKEYGLVGLIDTGTDLQNGRLQAYVDRRVVWIRTAQNNSHGSFVGGLIANARALNGGNPRFPSCQSRIVDIVALDSTGMISEFDLVTVIDRAVRENRDVKVWNLSLGDSESCKDRKFSLLACKLDSIAKKFKVLFVIAAGNYETVPLRQWPPDDLGEADRICAPADSIRGLTVGSIAHISNPSTCVDVDEPSAFSRRGPAPHFHIKPELSHYGGNCDANGDCLQCGVVSVDGAGALAESIGTSFATPSIATIASNIFRELAPEGDVSPAFVKGLMAHSAFQRSGKPDARSIRYRGLGSPGDLGEILNCTQSEATIIFHAELTDRYFFEKHDFPMPRCLNVAGKGLQAEVFMTLAYDPPTDARYGIEYCRTNITASLGTVTTDRYGKEKYTGQLKPAPADLNNGCDAKLVSEGFRWAPLKFYYRSFSAGPPSSPWRLHLELLNRDGHVCREPQKLTLFLTIRDPNGTALVYDSMVSEMERLAWGAQDLKLASRTRVRRSRN